MNRTRFAFVVFTFAVLTAFAAAVSAAPSVGTFEITGGYAKTSAEFGITGNDPPGGGLTFGAGYWRSLAPTTSWGVELSYDNLGSMDYVDVLTLTPVTLSASVLRVTPEFRVNFGAPVGPSFFAQGGLGYYSVSSSVEVAGIQASASDGKIGFNVGAGVGFPVGPKTKLNFHGNYNSVSTEGTSTNYIGFGAGLGFSL